MQDWLENFLCCTRHKTLKKFKRDEIIVQTHWLVNNICKESLSYQSCGPSGIMNTNSGQYTLSRHCFQANTPPPHLHGRSGCMFVLRLSVGVYVQGSPTYGLPPKYIYA